MRLRFPLRRRQFVLTAASALLLSGCGRPDASPDAPKATFHGVDITGASYARQLSLKDLDGRLRSLDEFKGKVVFVFFGFTQCPDVCPTTMAEIAEVRRRLGPDGDKVQAIFVTVDPERDTPEVLKAYLGNLDKNFIGLRGTREETDAMAREFKVFYQKVPTSEGHYTIDHTAGGYLFDPQGHVRLFVRYGMGVDQLTADVRQLLASS
ncbi:SCO family protein [uncultured Aquabacterium sp.]|uniref:SCO family protein n=1 Tax=Aquabacterium sp. TaxID=1872578 RepID=UPI0025D076CA|nr:SCO family protein [uncultured Aquabacterium sp.]